MTCKNCGAKIPKDSPFCTVCGKDFDSPPSDMGTRPQNTSPQGFPRQPFGSSMGSAFMQMPPIQKRSFKKPALVTVVTFAIVAAIIIYIICDLNSNKTKIRGIWENNGSYTRFNNDGTLEPALGETDTKYKYEVSGDELKISMSGKTVTYKIIDLTSDTLTIRYTGDDSQKLVFGKINASDSQIDEIISKGKLRTANRTAETIYRSLDLKAESSTEKGYITSKPLDVSTLKDSNDPVEKKVYETMKNLSWGDHGYVFIHFDPTCSDDGSSENFVQWSKTADGEVTGQYPDPIPEDKISSVKFGKRFKK